MRSPVRSFPAEAATLAAYADLLQERLVDLVRSGHLSRDAARDFIAAELWEWPDDAGILRARLLALRVRLGSVPD